MTGPPDPTTLRDRLAEATPGERALLVLEAIGADPDGRLALGAEEGVAANLDGVDLGRASVAARLTGGDPIPSWWDPVRKGAKLRQADLAGARIRRADLRGADLGGAILCGAALSGTDLRGASLEEADLRGADLARARLARADLGKANLRDAMLEEAIMPAARLRFADLRNAVLEQAILRRADLWSARLGGAALDGADLRRANLREAHLEEAMLVTADLRRADLRTSSLVRADLAGANLRGALLDGANLDGASLKDARLEGLDLSRTRLAGVHLAGASFARTRLRREQLGDAVGEEVVGDFAQAARAYQGLERNFLDLGDPDAAGWAYRRRRRMQKRADAAQALVSFRERRWRASAERGARWASDQAVEWLCDYGESVPRVLATMALTIVLFAAIYGVIGGVVRVSKGPGDAGRVSTRAPGDLALFSILAMTTSGSPVFGLEPSSEKVQLLMGLQGSLGIALTGLLGFVLGNRVRR